MPPPALQHGTTSGNDEGRLLHREVRGTADDTIPDRGTLLLRVLHRVPEVRLRRTLRIEVDIEVDTILVGITVAGREIWAGNEILEPLMATGIMYRALEHDGPCRLGADTTRTALRRI